MMLSLLCAAAWAQRDVGAQRECATCHIMWLNDFKRGDITTLVPYEPRPKVDTGRQDVVSTKRMCLSCHDGFVLDSRELWSNGHDQHPVGVKPTDKITLPVIDGKNMFPLNDEGKLYCGSCHSAHGVEWERTDTPVFMRLPSRDGDFCTACHRDQGAGPTQGSHPVDKRLEHKPTQAYHESAGLISNQGKVMCQSCHSPHKAADAKLLVMPNDASQLCGACHTDRNTTGLAGAAKARTHPVNIVPQQAKVPPALLEHDARVGKKGELICQTCHRPHAALGKQGLLIADNKDAALCKQCHAHEAVVENGKHDMREIDAASKNIRGQRVSEGGSCSACHLPHQGKGPKMWARETPAGVEPMAGLCLSCHQQNALAAKHGVGEFTHPVGADARGLERDASLPLYTQTGLKTSNAGTGKVTCASCHDPHRWDPKHADKKSRPGKPGDASNRFLRKPQGADSELCRACHAEKWQIANSNHDLVTQAPKSLNAFGQRADKSGACGACHVVHNALGPRLWARDLPEDAPVTAVTCLSCHRPDGLAKDKPIDTAHSHPIDVPITRLGIKPDANGWHGTRVGPPGLSDIQALPLYTAKGQGGPGAAHIGCGSCHDPHRASVAPTHSDTQTKKKDKPLNMPFLRIAQDNASELCVNCHREQAAVGLSPHGAQLPTEKKKKNTLPGGVCANCHRPHATKGPLLWARGQGPGEHPIAALCTDCHQTKGVAERHLTGTHSHPLGVSPADTPKGLPLYNHNARADARGTLDCATCHNPHQWNPNDIADTTGQEKDIEGDAHNSFLRYEAVDAKLCLECHPTQAVVVKTDHDLAVTAPEARNAHGQDVAQSGTCGACHSVHNAAAELRLWARKPGPGDNPAERLCRSCHRPNGSAAIKQPPQTEHPQDIQLWSGKIRRGLHPGLRADIQVVGPDGRAADMGSLTCTSCHNPHQWQPGTPRPGPGINTEGDVLSSFLRVGDSEYIVCADCHGPEALFRYKYFHGEKAHARHGLVR